MGDLAYYCIVSLVLTSIILLCALFIWLFYANGIDKLRNPYQWRNKGSSGEQAAFLTLTKDFHIPEKQILRNLYIPKSNKKFTEIDLLVVSTRGLLVFECKNYAGKIYGNAKRRLWVQYLGRKKSYFYNPFMQNRGHVKYLREYLKKTGIVVDNLPIIPMVITVRRGEWRIRNFAPDDYLLGYNCKLKDILGNLPVSETAKNNLEKMIMELEKLSRN